MDISFYYYISVPPSGLTMIHLQDSQLEKNHQTPVTVNSMYILPNNHFTNYISDHSVNRHVYTTNELNQIVDRDLSRIVADDPKTELFIDYNRNYMDHFKQASDTQYTSHNIPLKEMLVRHESSSYTGNMYNRIPKIWTVEKKKLIVSCHTSPSKPASTIQWHLAGILLTKNSDKSHSFSDHQNSLIHYTIKEQIINVSDKSILSSNAESVLFPNTSVTSSTDDVHMQVTQSQLNLTVERKYQHWQLECSVNIEDVKIQIINQTEQVNLREGQLIHFECIAKTSPLTPIYSWTIGNPVPSVNFETFNLLTDDQLKSNNNIDDKHEHNLIDIQMNASILQLTVNRAMHHKRIRCWVGVEAPELLEKITNASLQGVLSNKDSTCESDCRQLRNSLRKKLKDMTWVKSDYRLEVTYGPEFSSPSNDILSGELGQIIHLECSANSNPEADVSLYYIGPEGQILLEEVTKSELTQYQHHYNRPVDSKHPKYLVWNSETEYAEFNISIVKAAIHSSGRKLLGSDIKQVSHKLHLTSHEQFGFYACIAQTTGYPSIYRTVYVGQAESPKILKIDQSISLDGTFAELFCTIYSIPRPTVHQITWSINGISIKPDKRLRIYQEKTHRGVTSILTLNNLRPNDFSTYNCTVVNDYGSDWKLITLSSDNKWPLTFAVISGFAALLGVLFVTIICCFIRYTRLKGTNSKVYYKSKQENNLQNNEENKQISDGVELQSILKNKLNQTGLSKANPIEDVTLTNNECYPVQNVYKSNVDDTGIGKCTSHDLGTSECFTNDMISNIKQSDITSIIHSHSPKPWIQNINELKNSMTPPLAFSSYTNHSTSLAPIFLMTSDLNYSTGIHQDFNNSNTSTVIIPPMRNNILLITV
ncbi:nephrin related [Schistosoma mansoni]|uniref:nephrin related n=1 Tax=Schistosoma mansoni TaxID=6183 RepID=UPI00022C81C3|nr:nephrin related [Schistosoma mansoni]|eukprot:XP_018647123.1 nephrin related [Schistosoma mansoni]